MSYRQINAFKHGMNCEEFKVKMLSNVLEQILISEKIILKIKLLIKVKLSKKYWGDKHKWETAYTEENICINLSSFFTFLIIEKHLECRIFRKPVLIIQDGARKIIHTVAFT